MATFEGCMCGNRGCEFCARDIDRLDAAPAFDPLKAAGSLALGASLLTVLWLEFRAVFWAIDSVAALCQWAAARCGG